MDANSPLPGPTSADAPIGLLLAAGGGRRMGGRPKALLRAPDGSLLVDRAVRTLHAGGCARVLVVLGARAETVLAQAELPGCEITVNDAWQTGLASSLRTGLAAMPQDATAALVTLVDTPGLTPAAVARVLASGADLATAVYAGTPAHPVLLARRFWSEATSPDHPDSGARRLLRDHAATVARIDCTDIADPTDLDTPEAWAAWCHDAGAGAE